MIKWNVMGNSTAIIENTLNVKSIKEWLNHFKDDPLSMESQNTFSHVLWDRPSTSFSDEVIDQVQF